MAASRGIQSIADPYVQDDRVHEGAPAGENTNTGTSDTKESPTNENSSNVTQSDMSDKIYDGRRKKYLPANYQLGNSMARKCLCLPSYGGYYSHRQGQNRIIGP